MNSDNSNKQSSVNKDGYLSFSKFCRYARNRRIEFIGKAGELIFNESAVVGEFTNGALCDKHNLKEIYHLIKTGRILVNNYDKKRWLYPSDKEESLDAIMDEVSKHESEHPAEIQDKRELVTNVCEAAYSQSQEYDFKGV